jgi:hypothetical protein
VTAGQRDQSNSEQSLPVGLYLRLTGSSTEELSMSKSTNNTSSSNPDFLWGMRAIAGFMNRKPEQVYPLVAQNKIKGVKKVNGRYVGYIPKMMSGLIDDDVVDDADTGATEELNGA